MKTQRNTINAVPVVAPSAQSEQSKLPDSVVKVMMELSKIINIQVVQTYCLRNDIYFQYHTEFQKLVTKFGADSLKIAHLFEAYLVLYNRVDEALKKVNKSIFTKQIQDADKARDEVWTGLLKLNGSALKHFSPEIRLSAQKLKILFDTYGNVAKMPLDAQTSATYNILQELQGKYAADVESVGAGVWVSELQVRNDAFGELVRDRDGEYLMKSNIVLKVARADLDFLYRAIVKHVNAVVIVYGADGYDQFIKSLNIVIARYNKALSAKMKRAAVKGAAGDDGVEDEVEVEEPDDLVA